jgi:hypothetical protein
MRRRGLALGAAALASAMFAAGCSSGAPTASQAKGSRAHDAADSPRGVLAAALGRHFSSVSGTMRLAVLGAEGTPLAAEAKKLVVDARYAGSGRLYAWSITTATQRVRMIVDGDRNWVFIELPKGHLALGNGKPWIREPIAALSGGFSLGGDATLEPSDSFARLRDQLSDVTAEGTVAVGGVRMSVYRIRASASKLFASEHLGANTSLFDRLAADIGTVTYRVGVAAHEVRALSVSVPLGRLIEAELPGASSAVGPALAKVKEVVSFTFASYGSPVRIDLPPAAEVKIISSGGIDPFAGSGSGSSGSGSAGL